MTLKQKSLQPGMSFLEIMIVLAIMVTFLTLVGPRLMSLLGRGKKTATQTTLANVAAGIKQFKIDTGTFPANLQDLIRRPEGLSGWDGPYAGDENSATPDIPKDAWGQDLRYERAERGAIPPYKLWSVGDPDKEEDRIYAK